MRLKVLKSLTVLRLVIGAVKRKENVTKRTRRNITKREEKRERAKGSQLNAKIKHEIHPNSELNVLMKGNLPYESNLPLGRGG